METLKVIKCELRIRQKRNCTTWEVLTVTMYSDGSVTRTVLCERGTEEEARSVISRSGNDSRYFATPGPEDHADTQTLTQEQMKGGKRMNEKTEGELTQEDVLEYLRLVDRKVWLMDQAPGDKWKPEYAQEMEKVDKKIAVLRVRVDAAIAARDARRGSKYNHEGISNSVQAENCHTRIPSAT